MNKNDWILLDWDYVCDMVPAVKEEHDRVGLDYEYGLDWNEFIHDENRNLHVLAQEWWDKLPDSKKRELLSDRMTEVSELLRRLEDACGRLD